MLSESAAESVGKSAVAVLLTGIGTDGAKGMLKIQQAGGRTIAQDEAAFAISGMPKAATELGAADQSLSRLFPQIILPIPTNNSSIS